MLPRQASPESFKGGARLALLANVRSVGCLMAKHSGRLPRHGPSLPRASLSVPGRRTYTVSAELWRERLVQCLGRARGGGLPQPQVILRAVQGGVPCMWQSACLRGATHNSYHCCCMDTRRPTEMHRHLVHQAMVRMMQELNMVCPPSHTSCILHRTDNGTG